ncbi:MAG: chemotaxis protein [Azospirillum sp.]|nr:chemotaxis protein [Azospirillum sp.]
MKLSKFLLAAALPCLILAGAGSAYAADAGTPAEAKAMVEAAKAALKADQAAALAMFTKKEGAFGLKDLYVFCGGADGNFTAHPSLIGKSLKGLMDKGSPASAVGEMIYKAGAAGGGEVTYMWPQVAGEAPKTKHATVFTSGDQVCAVGYYE